MILDPYGEVLAESRELGDDVVVALLTGDKIREFLGPALSAGAAARALRQARRTAASGPGTRHHPRLEGLDSMSRRTRPELTRRVERRLAQPRPDRDGTSDDSGPRPTGDAKPRPLKWSSRFNSAPQSRSGCHDAKARLDQALERKLLLLLGVLVLDARCASGLRRLQHSATPERVRRRRR